MHYYSFCWTSFLTFSDWHWKVKFMLSFQTPQRTLQQYGGLWWAGPQPQSLIPGLPPFCFLPRHLLTPGRHVRIHPSSWFQALFLLLEIAASWLPPEWEVWYFFGKGTLESQAPRTWSRRWSTSSGWAWSHDLADLHALRRGATRGGLEWYL